MFAPVQLSHTPHICVALLSQFLCTFRFFSTVSLIYSFGSFGLLQCVHSKPALLLVIGAPPKWRCLLSLVFYSFVFIIFALYIK